MENKIKAVIDTSVYIAVLKSTSKTSAPTRIIQNLHDGKFLAILSPQIVEEILNVADKWQISEEKIDDFFETLKGNVVKITGDYVSYELDQVDLKDNIILAAGLEGKADYIISLDKKVNVR